MRCKLQQSWTWTGVLLEALNRVTGRAVKPASKSLGWLMLGLLTSCQPAVGQLPSQAVAVQSGALPLDKMQAAVADAVPQSLARAIARHPLEKETVSLRGLGPIQIDMTVEEATAAAGLRFDVAPEDQNQSCQYYLPHPDESIDGIGLMVVNGRIIRIDIWPGSAIATDTGLHIGSEAAAVAAQYPDTLQETSHAYTQGKYLTLMPQGEDSLYGIVFETDPNGKVAQYRTGQFPAVTWIEGCS